MLLVNNAFFGGKDAICVAVLRWTRFRPFIYYKGRHLMNSSVSRGFFSYQVQMTVRPRFDGDVGDMPYKQCQ
jgi:hypothetical protein